jgi:peptide/nickel transport system permease protein
VSLVFLLQELSPFDPVEETLLSSFGDRSFNKDALEDAYIREARAQFYHLPAFYISIRPSYFPKGIQEEVRKDRRKLRKNLLRFTRCAECADSFIKARDYFLNEAKGLNPGNELKIIIDRFERSSSLKDLNSAILGMNSLTHIDEESKANIGIVSKNWNSLKPASSGFIYPIFSWNGTQNRYHQYFNSLLSGDFGKSKTDSKEAIGKILKALKWTLSINILAFLFAASLGLYLGIWSFMKEGSSAEKGISTFFYFWYTMPEFWTATLLIIFFTTEEYGKWTNIFPSAGIKYWYSDQPILTQIGLNARQLMLPVICLTLPSLAYVSRLMKSKMNDVKSSDFILGLRAKGLSNSKIVYRHILRNAMIPYITILTGSIPGLFAGALVIEIIFNIPGTGKLMYDSILSTDWSVISGLVILLSLVTVLSYMLADVLYALVNPKINVVNNGTS